MYVPETGGIGIKLRSEGHALPWSPVVSLEAGKYSQRKPRSSVKRGLTLMSSSANNEK